jgi:hypothetical protein
LDIKGLTVGDIKAWATSELHRGLEAVVNAKQDYREPYYIIIIMKEGYQGPPAYGNNNELLHGKDTRQKRRNGPTKSMDLSNKRVMTHRFILSKEKPLVPLLGSAVVYVNNKTGEVKFEYILPPDKPMIGGFDVELESETIQKCEQGMPVVYGAKR